MTETENQIVGSKQELKNAVIKGGFSKLPQPMKDYISKFAAAVTNGDTQTFVNQQAKVAMNYALGSKYTHTLSWTSRPRLLWTTPLEVSTHTHFHEPAGQVCYELRPWE